MSWKTGPHQERQRGDLKEDPELGLGGWGDDIGEHSLLLDNDLEHIWDHASGVPQGVLLTNVVADQALVVGVVKCGAQVSGGEHLALACTQHVINRISNMLRSPESEQLALT